MPINSKWNIARAARSGARVPARAAAAHHVRVRAARRRQRLATRTPTRLPKLLRGIPWKVNLIPWNPHAHRRPALSPPARGAHRGVPGGAARRAASPSTCAAARRRHRRRLRPAGRQGEDERARPRTFAHTFRIKLNLRRRGRDAYRYIMRMIRAAFVIAAAGALFHVRVYAAPLDAHMTATPPETTATAATGTPMAVAAAVD